MLFSRDGQKKGRSDAAAALAEIHRLHGAFIDEFRAVMEHMKRSVISSLKGIEEVSKQSDELAEAMAARADQINSLAADVDRFEARIGKVESMLADLRATILVSGLRPPGAG